jgi:autotransporter-associated beta strand protein
MSPQGQRGRSSLAASQRGGRSRTSKTRLPVRRRKQLGYELLETRELLATVAFLSYSGEVGASGQVFADIPKYNNLYELVGSEDYAGSFDQSRTFSQTGSIYPEEVFDHFRGRWGYWPTLYVTPHDERYIGTADAYAAPGTITARAGLDFSMPKAFSGTGSVMAFARTTQSYQIQATAEPGSSIGTEIFLRRRLLVPTDGADYSFSVDGLTEISPPARQQFQIAPIIDFEAPFKYYKATVGDTFSVSATVSAAVSGDGDMTTDLYWGFEQVWGDVELEAAWTDSGLAIQFTVFGYLQSDPQLQFTWTDSLSRNPFPAGGGGGGYSGLTGAGNWQTGTTYQVVVNGSYFTARYHHGYLEVAWTDYGTSGNAYFRSSSKAQVSFSSLVELSLWTSSNAAGDEPGVAFKNEPYEVFVTATNRTPGGVRIPEIPLTLSEFRSIGVAPSKDPNPGPYEAAMTIPSLAGGEQRAISLGRFLHNWQWIPEENPVEGILSNTAFWKAVSNAAWDFGNLIAEAKNLFRSAKLISRGAIVAQLIESIDLLANLSLDREDRNWYRYMLVNQSNVAGASADKSIRIDVPTSRQAALAGYVAAKILADVNLGLAITSLITSFNKSPLGYLQLAATKGYLDMARLAYDTAKDPPDPDFRVFVTVEHDVPEVPGASRLEQDRVRLQGEISAYRSAASRAVNKADGAQIAGDWGWQVWHLRDAADFTVEASRLEHRLSVLETLYASATPAVTEADVSQFSAGIAADGLPAGLAASLRAAGFTETDITGLTNAFAGLDPAVTAANANAAGPIARGTRQTSAGLGYLEGFEFLLESVRIVISRGNPILPVPVEDVAELDARDQAFASLSPGELADGAREADVDAQLEQLRKLIVMTRNLPVLEPYLSRALDARVQLFARSSSSTDVAAVLAAAVDSGSITADVASQLRAELDRAARAFAAQTQDTAAVATRFAQAVDESLGSGIEGGLADALFGWAASLGGNSSLLTEQFFVTKGGQHDLDVLANDSADAGALVRDSLAITNAGGLGEALSVVDGKLRLQAAAVSPGRYEIAYSVFDDSTYLRNTQAMSLVVLDTSDGITLSATSIAENAGADAVVGVLGAIVAGGAAEMTYSIVTGTGAGDGASFDIVGNELRATAGFDYETKHAYTVLIRGTDGLGLELERVFIISVTDVNEGPTAIRFDIVNSLISENLLTDAPIWLGDFQVVDDALGTNSVWLEGPDADSFEVVGTAVYLKAGVDLDHVGKPRYVASIQVRDQDIPGSQTVSADVLLEIADGEPLVMTLQAVTTPGSPTVDSVVVTFSESVVGVGIEDFLLRKDGLPVSLAGAAVSGSGASRTLSGLAGIAGAVGAYELELVASGAGIMDLTGNALGWGGSVSWVVSAVNLPPQFVNVNPVYWSLPRTPATGLPASLVVATLFVFDDDYGTNEISLSGPNAADFEIGTDSSGTTLLYLKAGVVLDGAVEASKSVTVSVRDESFPDVPVSATCSFSIATGPARFAFGNVYGESTYPPPAFVARPSDSIPFAIVNGPLDTATLSLDDFVLTRDGVVVPWTSGPSEWTPALSLYPYGAAGPSYIHGLNGLTAARGTYQISFTGGATDILGTPLPAASFTWTNSDPVNRVSGPNGWAIALEPTVMSAGMYVAKTTVAIDGSMIAVGSFNGTVDFDPRTDTSVSLTSSAHASGDSGFIARYDATGTIVSAWQIDAPVTAVTISGTRLMIGGTFSGSRVDLDPRAAVTTDYDADAGTAFFLVTVDLATGASLATSVFPFTPTASGTGSSWPRNQMDTITTTDDGRVFFSGLAASGSLALGTGSSGAIGVSVPDGQADGFVAVLAAGGSPMWARRLEAAGTYSYSPLVARDLMHVPATSGAGLLALGIARTGQLGMIPGDVAPATGEALVIGLDAATGAYWWRSTVATGSVEEGDLVPLAITEDGRLHAAAHVWQPSGPPQSTFVTIDPATGSRIGAARNLNTLLGASSAVFVGGLIPRTDGSVVATGLMYGATSVDDSLYLLKLGPDTGGTASATAVQISHEGWAYASGGTSDGRFIFESFISDSKTFPIGTDGAAGRLIPATGSAAGLWSIRDPFATVTPPAINVQAGQTTTDAATHSGSYLLVKQGAGTLILDKANSHIGGTVVEAGEIVVRHGGALGAGTVVVKPGARLTLDVGPQPVSVAGLDIQVGGLVDVGTGRIVLGAGTFDLAAIRGQLAAGHGAGVGPGATGIASGTAAATLGRAVGHAFDGVGNIVVGFAAFGDLNLDGIADFDDILAFISAGRFDTGQAATWDTGDFDYNGVVDFDDVLAMISAGVFDQGPYLPAVSTPTTQSSIPAAESLAFSEPKESQQGSAPEASFDLSAAAFASLANQQQTTADASAKKKPAIRIL